MRNRRGLLYATVAAAVVLLISLPQAASRNFVPDVVFKGSSLTGWRVVGQADWRAENGEIVGTPKAGGWLVADRSYQDVAFFSSFRCAPECKTGLLLRAETTADGGMKGIFVSLTEGDLASYRVTVDAQGVETSREALRSAGGGQLRVAPPPAPAPAAGQGGRGRGARGRGGRGFGPQMPGGIDPPITRPATGLRAGEWNTIDLIIDANILRPFLNDAGGLSGGVADAEFGSFGPIALYAGGTGEVRFKDVSFKDLQPRVALPEETSRRFRMQALNEFYYSWGPDVADFNRDGVMDIVAGPYYYLGPDYSVAREIYMAETLNPGTQYFNGVQFAYDFTGDGWPDVINSLFTRPTVLYVNPKRESRRWEMHTVTDRITSELALMKDVNADGKLDYIFKDSENRFVYANPDPANPTGTWQSHAISEPGPWANHGMGVGDVNKDGRLDFLNAFGWWEQRGTGAEGAWTYHPEAFGRWTRSSPGGAEMAVYDINGDGLNDIVSTLQAHGWGLSWFEQKKGAGGTIAFEEHPIMGDFSTKNAGGVTFSQLHGSAVADIDGDGIQDFITGKRFWSHLDTFIDPDPHGAPVLYVYRTVRNPKAPGGAEFVPELLHNRSGIGSDAAVVDLNKDGAIDIITSTRRGTFIFWNNWKKPATTSSANR
ncbi:MAG: FG-GAP-like repeat-containing protein [Vicinamibacterales bacterium]